MTVNIIGGEYIRITWHSLLSLTLLFILFDGKFVYFLNTKNEGSLFWRNANTFDGGRV